MQLSKDKVEWAYLDRSAILSPEPSVIANVSPSAADPQARQRRKVALMAALSDGLPTLPAYVFELNSMLAASPVDLKRVAEIIGTDPSLTAQVLRLCNSAFMGFRERVTKIENAVMLVGTERLPTMGRSRSVPTRNTAFA